MTHDPLWLCPSTKWPGRAQSQVRCPGGQECITQQRRDPREGWQPPESGHFCTSLLSTALQGPWQQKLRTLPSLLGLFTGRHTDGSMSRSESRHQQLPARSPGSGTCPLHTPLTFGRAPPSRKLGCRTSVRQRPDRQRIWSVIHG